MLHRLLLIPIALLLHACASPSQLVDRIASKAELSRSVVIGTGYRHVVYANAIATTASETVFVYIEGDGRPWRGTRPAADPTTRKPVALQLLAETRFPGIYVSRPCYQEMNDPGCTPSSWTDARYSEAIVSSMASAIGKASGGRKLVLVGYSGGGTLALLLAERLADVQGVITIGANLDTDAWTTKRNFLPLAGSINPAMSQQAHPWPEIHLQGQHDIIVPPSTTERYFESYPRAQREQVDGFDHVCCWVEEWRRMIEEAVSRLAASG
ncbi:pimeloyl-ACP methyl ester carboxylesterase [Povalibacter uvarum]|uniref:Pimeloyl-ACP methyl ester carboxylesterase n=2 Tax=Povalibacter uvarum TaxID=732238 RepID=A0A841HLS9_9GAMM|nr:pimeloyl-ACP methyl ester carboxylesterase [Povalibacter uvarum]